MVGIHIDTKAHTQYLGLRAVKPPSTSLVAREGLHPSPNRSATHGVVFDEVPKCDLRRRQWAFPWRSALWRSSARDALSLQAFPYAHPALPAWVHDPFPEHLTRYAIELVDGFDHVHGIRIVRLVSNRPRNRLTNPPGSVGRKLVPRRYSNLSTAFIKPILPS